MIFGHSLAECRKAAVAAGIFLASTVALLVAYDPGIKQALIVLIGNGFAVAAVFLAPKFSVEDLTKTVGQLIGSVQSLLTFFVIIDPNVWVVVGSVVSLIPVGYAVWKTKNLAPINMEPSPVVFGPPPILSVGGGVETASPAPPGPPDPPVPPRDRPVE